MIQRFILMGISDGTDRVGLSVRPRVGVGTHLTLYNLRSTPERVVEK